MKKYIPLFVAMILTLGIGSGGLTYAEDSATQKKQLDTAIVKTKEGLVIRRIEYFSVHQETGSEHTGGPYSATVKEAWPQIDSPVNDGQRQWNALMAKNKRHDEKTEGHYCDWNDDYKIIFTGPDFISLQRSNWMYCHGAPHGYGSMGISNRILSANRELIASDIFKVGTRWEDVLGAIAWKAIFPGEAMDSQNSNWYKRFKNEVLSPRSWVFKPEGLGIQFASWDATGGARDTPTFCLIPWEKLKPYLAENSAITIPPER